MTTEENWCKFVCRGCEQELPEGMAECPNPECVKKFSKAFKYETKPTVLNLPYLETWLAPQVGTQVFCKGGFGYPNEPEDAPLDTEMHRLGAAILRALDRDYRLPDVHYIGVTSSSLYQDWDTLELLWELLVESVGSGGYFVRWETGKGRVYHAFIVVDS